MQRLTPSGFDAVRGLADRYGVSVDAVTTLLHAVSAGGGSMAQFYHQELGGGGQWMRGGMTMVGDMFNHGLQATVAGLCSELSVLLSSQPLFVPPAESSGGGGGIAHGNAWWPGDLGQPSSSGGQNEARYAYFPQRRRLAILRDGQVKVYDSLDHQIGGVQQQQGGGYGSLSFTSQFGTFTVDSLPLIEPPPPWQPSAPPAVASFSQAWEPTSSSPAVSAAESSRATATHQEILATLERLGALRDKGILSDDEFRAKKAELLGRL